MGKSCRIASQVLRLALAITPSVHRISSFYLFCNKAPLEQRQSAERHTFHLSALQYNIALILLTQFAANAFQSTLSARGRHGQLEKKPSTSEFQSTLTTRGAT